MLMKPIPHPKERKQNEVRIGFKNIFIYAQFGKRCDDSGKIVPVISAKFKQSERSQFYCLDQIVK